MGLALLLSLHQKRYVSICPSHTHTLAQTRIHKTQQRRSRLCCFFILFFICFLQLTFQPWRAWCALSLIFYAHFNSQVPHGIDWVWVIAACASPPRTDRRSRVPCVYVLRAMAMDVDGSISQFIHLNCFDFETRSSNISKLSTQHRFAHTSPSAESRIQIVEDE